MAELPVEVLATPMEKPQKNIHPDRAPTAESMGIPAVASMEAEMVNERKYGQFIQEARDYPPGMGLILTRAATHKHVVCLNRCYGHLRESYEGDPWKGPGHMKEQVHPFLSFFFSNPAQIPEKMSTVLRVSLDIDPSKRVFLHGGKIVELSQEDFEALHAKMEEQRESEEAREPAPEVEEDKWKVIIEDVNDGMEEEEPVDEKSATCQDMEEEEADTPVKEKPTDGPVIEEALHYWGNSGYPLDVIADTWTAYLLKKCKAMMYVTQGGVQCDPTKRVVMGALIMRPQTMTIRAWDAFLLNLYNFSQTVQACTEQMNTAVLQCEPFSSDPVKKLEGPQNSLEPVRIMPSHGSRILYVEDIVEKMKEDPSLQLSIPVGLQGALDQDPETHDVQEELRKEAELTKAFDDEENMTPEELEKKREDDFNKYIAARAIMDERQEAARQKIHEMGGGVHKELTYKRYMALKCASTEESAKRLLQAQEREKKGLPLEEENETEDEDWPVSIAGDICDDGVSENPPLVESLEYAHDVLHEYLKEPVSEEARNKLIAAHDAVKVQRIIAKKNIDHEVMALVNTVIAPITDEEIEKKVDQLKREAVERTIDEQYQAVAMDVIALQNLLEEVTKDNLEKRDRTQYNYIVKCLADAVQRKKLMEDALTDEQKEGVLRRAGIRQDEMTKHIARINKRERIQKEKLIRQNEEYQRSVFKKKMTDFATTISLIEQRMKGIADTISEIERTVPPNELSHGIFSSLPKLEMERREALIKQHDALFKLLNAKQGEQLECLWKEWDKNGLTYIQFVLGDDDPSVILMRNTELTEEQMAEEEQKQAKFLEMQKFLATPQEEEEEEEPAAAETSDKDETMESGESDSPQEGNGEMSAPQPNTDPESGEKEMDCSK